MTIHPNGTGTPPSTGLLATQPLTVAGAFLISVQAVMAAVFGVVDDAGLFPWLTLGTQATMTAAAMSLAVFLTLVWAARHTTPRQAPVLPENTAVGVTNGTGKVVAVATIPSASDAIAHQADDASQAA
jgi:hypothetical protein